MAFKSQNRLEQCIPSPQRPWLETYTTIFSKTICHSWSREKNILWCKKPKILCKIKPKENIRSNPSSWSSLEGSITKRLQKDNESIITDTQNTAENTSNTTKSQQHNDCNQYSLSVIILNINDLSFQAKDTGL